VGDRLVCPCHGSEYDLLGRVLEGPAERPLTRFPVSVEGDDLVIVLTGGGR
jgi:Rieske Fe-S protein